MCLIPSCGMLFFGESKAGANEVLAKFPDPVDKNGSFNIDYLSGISDWAGDRFAFRQEMITAWSWLNAGLFRTSAEDKVIIGDNGWLFYSESIDDYRGFSLEDHKLEAIARNLSLMQEFAEINGADFVFTIAPNKNSLYPEYMPDYVPYAVESASSKKLLPYLEKYNVNYVDLFTALSSQSEILYFRTDSHWNSRGAALAADAILSGLGRDGSFYGSRFSAGEEHKGDLYEMLYPAGNLTETDFSYVSGFSFATAKDPNGGNAVNIESSCENGNGRLMCWRDSFGVSLYPYLAESFHDARFSRSVTYDLIRLESEKTSSVIVEIVERNLSYLLENMPLYPAQERMMPEALTIKPPLAVSTETGKTSAADGMMLLQANIPSESAFSAIESYFVCKGTCYEASVLYPDGSTPVASAWVPSADTGEIAVIYGYDGTYCISDAA